MQEMREMWVQSPDHEDPLEEGMATHSSILARKNPVDKEHGQSPRSCEKSDMSEATGHTSIFLVYLRAMLISISVNSVHILGLFFYRILAFVFWYMSCLYVTEICLLHMLHKLLLSLSFDFLIFFHGKFWNFIVVRVDNLWVLCHA